MTWCQNIGAFLSSANEVWVGHRNASRPSVCLSVCPSVRPTCERDFLRTVPPIDFKL